LLTDKGYILLLNNFIRFLLTTFPKLK